LKGLVAKGEIAPPTRGFLERIQCAVIVEALEGSVENLAVSLERIEPFLYPYFLFKSRRNLPNFLRAALSRERRPWHQVFPHRQSADQHGFVADFANQARFGFIDDPRCGGARCVWLVLCQNTDKWQSSKNPIIRITDGTNTQD
jgi:hypothetical protein